MRKSSPEEQAHQFAAAKQFAIDAARLLATTRCHRVVVMDVSEISGVTDFMVLADGTSARQMKGVGDELEELGEPVNFKILSRVGDDTGQWIVLDFVDVVVHLFNQEARLFYDLDSLWGDAKRVNWDAAEPVGAR